MKKLDIALKRNQQLAAIVKAAREQALSNPKASKNFELGLLEKGEKGEERKLLVERFDQLIAAVDQLTIIDICAAFENDFRAQLGTALGEAQKAVSAGYKLKIFNRIKSRLLKDAGSLQSLASILSLADGLYTGNKSDLEELRAIRNNIAHGTTMLVPSQFTPERTHEILQVLLDELS